jgi:hypothetical protein
MHPTPHMARIPGHEHCAVRTGNALTRIFQRGSYSAFPQDTTWLRKPGHDPAASLVQVSFRAELLTVHLHSMSVVDSSRMLSIHFYLLERLNVISIFSIINELVNFRSASCTLKALTTLCAQFMSPLRPSDWL